MTEHYRKQGAKLRNIILFTIGGFKGIEIMERLTEEFREFWPEFEGFIGVYYEGMFNFEIPAEMKAVAKLFGKFSK